METNNYIEINTLPFPYQPGYHPETQSRDDSRDDMEKAMYMDANHYDFYEFRAKITVLRSTVYLLRISNYCRPGTFPHLNIIVII
jgi:hypothetical protein